MTSPSPRVLTRARAAAAGLSLLTVTLVPGLVQLPAFATGPTTAPAGVGSSTAAPPSVDDVLTLADAVPGLTDYDARGAVKPLASQILAGASLGATDLRWNAFGTPASILPADGVLASGYSKDPAKAPAAARDWLSRNVTLLGLTKSQVAGLELVNNARLAGSDARAVLFRQRFGSLTPAIGSMVTVGVADGRIAYVSSSLTRTTGTPAAAKLTPLQGWLAAAKNVGEKLTPAAVNGITSVVSGAAQGAWTRLTVPGILQEQQARVRALALADGSVRPVIEANVVNVAGGSTAAYTVLVDAVSGKILVRQNKVDNHEYNNVFSGAITATECGAPHAFDLTDNLTKTIVATATGSPLNDFTLKVFQGATLLTTADTATNPEAAVVTNPTGFPAGAYSVQVCPFDASSQPPFNYVATVSTSNSGAPAAGTVGPQPKWRFFTSNPSLTSLGASTPTNSVVGCWFTQAGGCSYPLGPLTNVQAPGPWDTVAGVGITTGTTVGNNANTHEAWVSPLTPGGLFQAPVSPTRDYTQPFTDAWNNSRCGLEQLVPGGNDINASVTDLFVSHNVMHDYSYYLGFTEANYNLQLQNLGRGGVEGDQEIGNAQAGAIGGAQTGLGRDNANQIALQDGIPGITNQYLFQPLAGAFYAPCTDGGLDFGIVGHEYTHAISNRMVGGPDENLTSEQGGAMGESWGDLNAAELQFARGFGNGGNVWAVGVYATQNAKTAIRDYAINKNPLNYSDYGFDSTGPEVHADGEIWNGTQWSVRQALVKKWNKKFPYRNKKLQRECSTPTATSSPRSAAQCPGNRRWIQLVFDSFLLQQGATSMLDARDAMLAADKMRFGGKDLKVMWGAFASRGMGKGASVKSADDTDPKPSFVSPYGKNAKVTFTTKSQGLLFVGDYEARVTPVADTNPRTRLDGTVKLAPGTYRMLYVGRTRGFTRFTLKVKAGETRVVKLQDKKNLASKYAGAKVIGATPGSRNADALIDSTEKTNWGGVTDGNVDATKPFVAVDLAGGVSRIKKFNVSAYLNPAPADPNELPLAADPDSASRFTALRRFALEVCVTRCASAKAKWRRVYTSRPNTFPGALPRPVAPNLNLRSFSLKKAVKAAAVRLVVLENQCTGFAGYAGEQDNDPLNDTDCKTASDRGTIVHAAELQVFGTRA